MTRSVFCGWMAMFVLVGLGALGCKGSKSKGIVPDQPKITGGDDTGTTPPISSVEIGSYGLIQAMDEQGARQTEWESDAKAIITVEVPDWETGTRVPPSVCTNVCNTVCFDKGQTEGTVRHYKYALMKREKNSPSGNEIELLVTNSFAIVGAFYMEANYVIREGLSGGFPRDDEKGVCPGLSTGSGTGPGTTYTPLPFSKVTSFGGTRHYVMVQPLPDVEDKEDLKPEIMYVLPDGGVDQGSSGGEGSSTMVVAKVEYDDEKKPKKVSLSSGEGESTEYEATEENTEGKTERHGCNGYRYFVERVLNDSTRQMEFVIANMIALKVHAGPGGAVKYLCKIFVNDSPRILIDPEQEEEEEEEESK